MKTIYISTSDPVLMDVLDAAELPGVEITSHLRAAISYDQAFDYVIKFIGLANGLISFYKFLKEVSGRKPDNENHKTIAEIDGHAYEGIDDILLEIERLSKKQKDDNDSHVNDRLEHR